MRWIQKGEREEGRADEARRALASLQAEIEREMEREQWGAADERLVRAVQLLRAEAPRLSVTQGAMAQLHGRWGLVLLQQRRYEEAHKHLALAERLFNMEIDEAVAWAEQEGINLQGEGDEVDFALALEVLSALADSTVRRGEKGARLVLRQVVEVADMLGNGERAWDGRQRLATYLAGMAAWSDLLQVSREMGALARQQRHLPALLVALQEMAEAYIGLQEMAEAIAVQALIVDISRHLNYPSLASEEAELARLKAGLASG